MKRLLFIIFSLGLPCSVHAQSPVAAWQFKIFNAGAPGALSTTPIPLASAQCNQPTRPAANNTNPTDLWWNDPVNAGKFCHYASQPTDPLITMPITGNPLDAALAACSSTGICSGDSARFPFTKPGTAPPVPTGFILQ